MYNRLANISYVNIFVHIGSMKMASLHGLPSYVWVFGVVCWLAHLGKLGWSTLCIHFPCIHFALALWCIMPGVRACVCVHRGDGGSHTWGGNRELLGQLLLAWNSLPCLVPGLETTTARSCHQSADVVGEIYTDTLKKQKDWGKNRTVIA